MTHSSNLISCDSKDLATQDHLADAKQRPSFRWSDIWKAPLHDFPIRDEILYQYLPLSNAMDILEVGPGSGYTAYRLAGKVRHLTLLEVAPDVVNELRFHLGSVFNLSCVCADIAKPGLAEKLGRDFDAVLGLDVFEYIVDPGMCLRNLAAVLRPGGHLLLTYPNLPPPAGDGVTYFSTLGELEELLLEAGFRHWEIFSVRLRPHAATVYGLLHEWPLRLYRAMRRGGRGARPQTYDATWAFQHRQNLLGFKVPLHLFWVLVAAGLRLGGEVFKDEPIQEGILGRQLVIRARR